MPRPDNPTVFQVVAGGLAVLVLVVGLVVAGDDPRSGGAESIRVVDEPADREQQLVELVQDEAGELPDAQDDADDADDATSDTDGPTSGSDIEVDSEEDTGGEHTTDGDTTDTGDSGDSGDTGGTGDSGDTADSGGDGDTSGAVEGSDGD